MNDICELWSLPWHALQKNLALGLGDDARGSAAPVAPLKTVKAQCVAASLHNVHVFPLIDGDGARID